MDIFNRISDEALEAAAGAWALEQIKRYTGAETAAQLFYEYRLEFILAYRKKEEESE